jgi:transposase
MAKYTEDFKLAVVQRYIEGTMGYKLVADQFNIRNRSLVTRWVGFFRVHGKDGLKAKRDSYDAAFKLSVLQHMWDNELSKGQAATTFNIRGHSTVGTWERAYRLGGIEALQPPRIRKPKMQPEQNKPEPIEVEDKRSREELLNELLYLRAEVAYLKKLDALVRSQAQSTPLSKVLRKKRK